MTDRTTPRFPLSDFLGMVTERAQRDSPLAQVEVTAAHLNPPGSVHGAVLFAMVDTEMGAATMSVLDNQLCAAIDVAVAAEKLHRADGDLHRRIRGEARGRGPEEAKIGIVPLGLRRRDVDHLARVWSRVRRATVLVHSPPWRWHAAQWSAPVWAVVSSVGSVVAHAETATGHRG